MSKSTLLTISMITREALRVLEDSLDFTRALQKLRKQLDAAEDPQARARINAELDAIKADVHSQADGWKRLKQLQGPAHQEQFEIMMDRTERHRERIRQVLDRY